MRFTRRDVFDVACIWKVYIDNFLEGYHLLMVHPTLSKVIDYREYHVDLFDWYSLQHSPIRDGTGAYGDGHAYYYFVYPNIMLNCVPGRLQSNRILPLGPDRCRVEFDFRRRGRRDAGPHREGPGFSDEVMEDIPIRGNQKAVVGRHAGRLCLKRESVVWHFHESLRAAYAGRNLAAGRALNDGLRDPMQGDWNSASGCPWLWSWATSAGVPSAAGIARAFGCPRLPARASRCWAWRCRPGFARLARVSAGRWSRVYIRENAGDAPASRRSVTGYRSRLMRRHIGVVGYPPQCPSL
jgi:hypothetical protein